MGEEIMDPEIIYVQYFTRNFFYLYSYAVLLLLTLVIIKNKCTPEAKNWLFVFNTLMAIAAVLNLFFLAEELFIAWYGESPYELHAFFENRINLPYRYYYMVIYLVPLTGLLFFFRRLRTNPVFILLFLLLFNLETAGLFILSFSRDYLPSRWSVNYSEAFPQMAVKWITVLLVLFFAYWFLHKRRKLPHPSLFLKNDVQPG